MGSSFFGVFDARLLSNQQLRWLFTLDINIAKRCPPQYIMDGKARDFNHKYSFRRSAPECPSCFKYLMSHCIPYRLMCDGKKGCSGEDYVEACLNACVSMQNVWRYCALPKIQKRWHVMQYNSSESSESEMGYSRKRVAVQGSNFEYDTYIPKCKGSINIRWWMNCIWDPFH